MDEEKFNKLSKEFLKEVEYFEKDLFTWLSKYCTDHPNISNSVMYFSFNSMAQTLINMLPSKFNIDVIDSIIKQFNDERGTKGTINDEK